MRLASLGAQLTTWLNNAYAAPYVINSIPNQPLMSALSVDLKSILRMNYNVVNEQLKGSCKTDNVSEILVLLTNVVLQCLRTTQENHKGAFNLDLNSLVCSANDFLSIANCIEDFFEDMVASNDLLSPLVEAMSSIFTDDAISAARSTHLYIFECITEGEDESQPSHNTT